MKLNQNIIFCNGAILAIGAALLSTTVFAAKPTYDCAKAASEVEELICQDDELAGLDHKIAEVYKAAVKNMSGEELKTLKAMQRGWIKGRNECWKAEDIRYCTQFEYESRITELQIQAGNLMVPKPVIYNCTDDNTITAYFYQDSQLPAAVLNRDNKQGVEQVFAMLSPSGSGSKYEGRNVTFWEKGGEAQVTWMDQDLKCQVK